MPHATIQQALQELQKGNFVIIMDDKARENEADLVLAAETATQDKLNFMLQQARGIMCVAMTGERLDELKIPMMVEKNTDRFTTPFTISVDAKQGTTTGVSIKDRLATIKALINPQSKPKDLARPGHMFPLRAATHGLKERQGHTEAAVELCRLAKLYPAAVICEMMDKKGEMANFDEMDDFSKRNSIQSIRIKDIIRDDY